MQSPGALLPGPPVRERGEGSGRRVDAPASAAEGASLSWWTAAAAAATAGVADSAISPRRTLGRPAPTAPLCPTPGGGREGRNVARAGETEKAKRARARVSRQAAFARLREIKVRIGSRGFVRPAKRPLAAKSRVTEKRRLMPLVGRLSDSLVFGDGC